MVFGNRLIDTCSFWRPNIQIVAKSCHSFQHYVASSCVCMYVYISRLTIVSREAKKKQAVRDERVCYLQVAPI